MFVAFHVKTLGNETPFRSSIIVVRLELFVCYLIKGSSVNPLSHDKLRVGYCKSITKV